MGRLQLGRMGEELGRIQSQSANLFHVVAGMVWRVVIYLDRDRALADLGLEEQAIS